VKKFKFRLQSVLDARVKKLEDLQLEMAQVQNEFRKQTEILENMYQTREKTRINLENNLDTGVKIDIIIIRNHQDYIEKLSNDIKNRHKIVSDKEIELEEKKKEVLEALKAKTIMDKLKEKDYKAFLDEVEKLDLKQIDEIAINRYKQTL
jgi:flagellar FliJ protein